MVGFESYSRVMADVEPRWLRKLRTKILDKHSSDRWRFDATGLTVERGLLTWRYEGV